METDNFDGVLNCPSTVNDNAINRLQQIECNVLLDDFPNVTESWKAIQHLSSGKALGADAIPAEVYKAGGLPMVELFQCMRRKEPTPQEFKDASIIHLYKRKGKEILKSVTTTDAYLLSIAGKILAKIQLIHLNVHLDQAWPIPESQCGI